MDTEELSEREIAEQKDQEERRQFVEGLRALADYYAAHLGVTIPRWHVVNVITTADEFRVAARAGGAWEKIFSDQWAVLRRMFGSVTLDIFTPRHEVCEARVVGTRKVPAQHIPAREEQIIEWDCAPVLALGPDADGG